MRSLEIDFLVTNNIYNVSLKREQILVSNNNKIVKENSENSAHSPSESFTE